MSDDLVVYYITNGDPSVKVADVGTKDGGPPDGELVISGVGPVEWRGRPNAFDGYAARFGVGQYKYTYVDPATGKVWASNDPNKSQDFYYVGNSGGSFISTGEGDMGHVWAMNEQGTGITIQDYNPGDSKQWFYANP